MNAQAVAKDLEGKSAIEETGRTKRRMVSIVGVNPQY
jgi:hypothetical protein